jgi:hypothetical protein
MLVSLKWLLDNGHSMPFSKGKGLLEVAPFIGKHFSFNSF